MEQDPNKRMESIIEIMKGKYFTLPDMTGRGLTYFILNEDKDEFESSSRTQSLNAFDDVCSYSDWNKYRVSIDKKSGMVNTDTETNEGDSEDVNVMTVEDWIKSQAHNLRSISTG
jgi:hypothetical protein